MERHHKPFTRKARNCANKDSRNVDEASSPWELPYIAELILEDQITIGMLRPVG